MNSIAIGFHLHLQFLMRWNDFELLHMVHKRCNRERTGERWRMMKPSKCISPERVGLQNV